jgi:hypothetical protein
MKSVHQLRHALIALGLCAFLFPAAGDDGPAAKITAKIESVRKAAAAKPDSDPNWKDAKPEIEAALQRSAASLHDGYLYLSLETLSQAITALRATELTTEKSESEVAKEGLPGVDRELEKARAKLAALNQGESQRNSDDVPLAIRALSEKGKGEADPLMMGGRGFAADSETPESKRTEYLVGSLYYVGMGDAIAEIVGFDEGLGLKRNGTAVPLRAIAGELQRLQDKVNASYRPPLSVEHHADFIRLNSSLKLAGELDANRSYAGALFVYLDALQQFGMIEAQAPDAAAQAKLKSSIEKMDHELKTSTQDSSLAELFLERAEAHLAKSPGANDWKIATAVASQVLPAYFAALKAPPPQDHPAPAEVTVTLVRWPYT